eukprot:504851_1
MTTAAPSKYPTIHPSVTPTSPTTNPTNYPSQSPIVYTGPCLDVGGGNWTLVRHAYNQWHPATDNLGGTDVYGTYSNNPESMSSWSIAFDQYLWPDGLTQFMFSDGNCSRWLITTNDQFTTNYPGQYSADILSSYTSPTPYSALWYNRAAQLEDPWISVADGQDVLYGENDNPYNDPTGDLFNVWIRILPTRNPTSVTAQPSGSPTDNPTASPTNYEYESTNYYYQSTPMNWTDADAYCQSTYATHLATIWDDDAADELFNFSSTNFWIGLHDRTTEGTW